MDIVRVGMVRKVNGMMDLKMGAKRREREKQGKRKQFGRI